MPSYVHQRNLRITPVPSNLTKYAQKTPRTKTPLSRGVTGKTFTDTEKNEKINKTKNKKPRNETQIPTGFGNPVISCQPFLYLGTSDNPGIWEVA